MSDDVLKDAMDLMAYVKDHKKLLEVLYAHDPREEVPGIEEFREICEIYGLTDGCVKELWDGMIEAKAESDAKTEGGVTFTYSCAMLSIALSLKEGKCKDCKHRPDADGIGEPISRMIQ